MSVSRLTILLAACGIVAASAIADLPKGYETLGRKSIFSRDRIAYAPRTRPTYTPPPPPASPVVTGIVREDGGTYVAIVETPGSREPAYVRLGGALPGNRGTVTEMNLDCLVFVPAAGAAPRKVLVGRNLDGAESTLVTAAATNPTTDPSSIQGDDIISRMRRRRLEGK